MELKYLEFFTSVLFFHIYYEQEFYNLLLKLNGSKKFR